MKFSLPTIRRDHVSFETLANLYAQTKESVFDDIVIDMSATDWFDADMCAVFGAILYSLGARLNKVNIIHIPQRVETILSKNGFLSHYGRVAIPDLWGTTIPYQRFEVEDDHFFANYIEDELINRSEIPEMSQELLKKFRASIFEIFSNAVLHSRTDLGIFSCGQFFPAKDQLDFTVADLGIGFCENIKDYTGQQFSPEDAITWATKEGHTTKEDSLPGGLGLKLLIDFIDLNGGCIQIASDAGYWQRKKRKTKTQRLSCPFPGTVVSIDIKTDDPHTYSLASELKAEDIF